MGSTSFQLARAGTLTALLVGIFVVVLRLALDPVLGSGSYPDAGIDAVAFAALSLAPSAIAGFGWRRDSGPLLLAAALPCGFMAILSVATIPYLIPAGVLIGAASRGRWTRRATLVAAAVAALEVGAWVGLLIWPAERCVESATSTSCGRIATTQDALVAIGLVVAGVALAASRLAIPGRARPIIAGDGDAEDPRPPGP